MQLSCNIYLAWTLENLTNWARRFIAYSNSHAHNKNIPISNPLTGSCIKNCKLHDNSNYTLCTNEGICLKTKCEIRLKQNTDREPIIKLQLNHHFGQYSEIPVWHTCWARQIFPRQWTMWAALMWAGGFITFAKF